MVGNEVIGNFGEIHPKLVQDLGVKKEKIFYAEFNVSLMQKYINPKFTYEAVSKYPVVYRDLAVVIDRDILVGNMIKEIRKTVKNIEKIDIFDIYQGEKIPTDKKSVAMSIALRDKTKTLSDTEIEEAMTSILKIVNAKFGGEIRQA